MCTRQPVWRDSEEEVVRLAVGGEKAASKLPPAAAAVRTQLPACSSGHRWADPPHVRGGITSSEPVAASCWLVECRMQSIDPVQRSDSGTGVLRTTAVDWWDSCEETVCDRTGRLGRAC